MRLDIRTLGEISVLALALGLAAGSNMLPIDQVEGPEIERKPVVKALPGEPCSADDDCKGGANAVCWTDVPGGFCLIRNCAIGGDDCPDGTLCVDKGGGAVCAEGACGEHAPCSRGAEVGILCEADNTCWYNPAAIGADPGQPCTQNSDCKGGDKAHCLTDMRGGYCVIADCVSDADCPGNSFCLDAGQGKFCAAGRCDGTEDCRGTEEYICDVDESCWWYPEEERAAPGAACTQHHQCKGGDDAFCATQLPGGYCIIANCTIGGTDCPRGSICIAAFSNGTGGCAEGPCTDDPSCSRYNEGYFCDADQSCWHSQ